MIVHRIAACLVVVLLADAVPSHATDVSGLRIDDRATVADTVLVLNGAGDVAPSGKGAYVGAFYMRAKKHSLKEVDELAFWPKRIALTMLRDTSGDDLGETLVRGIQRNSSPEETRSFGLQLTRLGFVFGNIRQLRRGSSIAIDWIPGRGTVFVVDGKPIDEPIPGELFYAALLKVWMGSQPVDVGLRNAMLDVR